MKNKVLIFSFAISIALHALIIFVPNLNQNSTSVSFNNSDNISISMGSISVPSEIVDIGSGRSGDAAESSGSEGSPYFDQVRRKIELAKRYPLLAKLSQAEGIAEVEFFVSKAGEVIKLKLVKSTKNRILDDEAILTVKRAAPFPPIPKSFNKSKLKIVVPIVYQFVDQG